MAYRELPTTDPLVACLWTNDARRAATPGPHPPRRLRRHRLRERPAARRRPGDRPGARPTARPARAFGVRFRVGAAGAALGLPAAELLDVSVPLEDVWGAAEARRIAERATSVPAARARRSSRATARRPPDPLVRAAATGTPRRVLGIGDRQLRRRFADAVGYGPKTLERILRFQRFLRAGAAATPTSRGSRSTPATPTRRTSRASARASPACRPRSCWPPAPGPPARGPFRSRRTRARRGHHGGMTVDLTAAADLPPRERPRPRAPPLRPPVRGRRRRARAARPARLPQRRRRLRPRARARHARADQPARRHPHDAGDPPRDRRARRRDDRPRRRLARDASRARTAASRSCSRRDGDPHAPWWQHADESSLTQTAANAAALHAWASATRGSTAPTSSCSRGSPSSTRRLGEDARLATTCSSPSPSSTPCRTPRRADAALDALAPASLRLTADPRPTELHTPLDLSPLPGARSRRLFDDAAIERHLDALAAGQQDDGGWRVSWPEWYAGRHARVARRRHRARAERAARQRPFVKPPESPVDAPR